jgi:hypothetical protein
MRTLTRTIHSQRLIEFLKRYPNQWHSIKNDKLTSKALDRCIALYPGRIAVTRPYNSDNPVAPYRVVRQIRFTEIA